MACSKYTLTNTGSSIANFSYRRCDDNMWEYQVPLDPSETKNIWLINNTYSTAFANVINKVDLGAFPPLNATATPTPTPTTTPTPTPTPSTTAAVTPTPSTTATNTPSVTASVTPTVTSTSTPTPTPTNVVRTSLAGLCHSESNLSDACDCVGTATLFVNGTSLSNSTLAWSDSVGPNTGDPTGYYVQDNIIYFLDGGCGIGCITGATISSVGSCGPTPTPTTSVTPTPSTTAAVTPTMTPTNTATPSSTPNNAWVVWTGATHDAACGQYNFLTTVYGDVSSSNFDYNTQWSNVSTFPPTIDMTGYIKNTGGQVAQLDTNGYVVGSYTLCATLTPTPTTTQTPTVTPSHTPTPTPTFGYYTYSLGTGATANAACTDYGSAPNTIYGTVAGGPGPNIGEFLYTTPGNPPTNPVADGYYSNGTAVFQVTGGSGQITAVDPTGC